MEGLHVIEQDPGGLNVELPMNTGEYNQVQMILNGEMHHMMTTSVCFDTHEQIFWAGTHTGHVTAYYGSSLNKYTAFQAHHYEVRKILPDSHGVLTLCPNEVRYTLKQGLKIFSARDEGMDSMRSMVRNDNYVLLAGENEHFYELDLTSGYVYQKSDIACEPNTVVVKQSNHYLCCGQKTGQVVLHDPVSLEACHKLEAHSGSLSDFDFNGNLLVTSGFSTRYNHLMVDRYLMVYDLRTLRAFPPVQVPIEPYFVRFLPTYTLRCLVMSLSGEFVLCQPDSLVVDPGMYKLNNQGSIMDCCVAETYECLGVGDDAGFVHLWADRPADQITFNHNSQETILPDEVEPLDAFDIDDWSIPLTSISLPDCSEPLLSDWPEELLKRHDRPTPPIDQDILKNMTIRQFVGYAPNPKTRLRNQVAYSLDPDDLKYPESPMSRDRNNSRIPKMYRKVDIKYSKYGVEGFDFNHYNQTCFSGLEIHIPNAYCNCMIQLLYFLEPLRVKISNHLCEEEFCLTCELSFLFHMLDIADNQTCQATNFLRTFRTLPEVSALGLLRNDNYNPQRSGGMIQIIQNWNRFVMRQLHQGTRLGSAASADDATSAKTDDKDTTKGEVSQPSEEDEKGKEGESKDEEGNSVLEEKTPDAESTEIKEKTTDFEEASGVKSIFGMDMLCCRTCRCGVSDERKRTVFTIDLLYPELKEDKEYPFGQLLQESLIRQERNQSWCGQCKKYQNTQQYRKVVSVPDILNINCQLDRETSVQFWKTQQELLSPKLPISAAKANLHFSPPKICRFGKFCNRPDCKFVHTGRDGGQKLSSSEADGSFGLPPLSWLPMFIEVKHNKETFEVQIDAYTHDEEIEPEGTIYKLVSNVCHIKDNTSGSTLVSHILASKSYHLKKEEKEQEQWYVFNDFAITPISEVDAVTFNFDWKIPCILIYSRVKIEDIHIDKVEPQISSSILFAEKSLAVKQSRFSRNFTPLNSTEILKEGDIVGVDAEFVTLNQEESEMKIDGTLSTLRPSQMSVARITVVRGWGPLEGVPFIDDYISTSEQVVDYLTKFSGIKPGDLDVTSSSKHLTTLKTSYQKLRYLSDLKVLFVGHGLKKDFRVINLVIPRDQIVDTVDLFHLHKQRFVSLKFLAWHFLNIKIQAGTHDSAEDAYTALKLYNKYRELLRAGEYVLTEELDILYETGRQYNWQVPE